MKVVTEDKARPILGENLQIIRGSSKKEVRNSPDPQGERLMGRKTHLLY